MKLHEEYARKKDAIKMRLSEFERFYNENVSWFYSGKGMEQKNVDSNRNSRIFEEMCFCILAANGTAASSMKAIDASRDILMTGSIDEIQDKLKSSGVRFHNRAEYIVSNREKMRKDHGMDIIGLIESYEDKRLLRDYLADYIKGFGFKESSHFLRNIGIHGLAILDKHILRSMHELGYISEVPKSLTKKKYLEIEETYHTMSKTLGIDPDELDLLLWSIKNGQILK